jgi:hypothetical protein
LAFLKCIFLGVDLMGKRGKSVQGLLYSSGREEERKRIIVLKGAVLKAFGLFHVLLFRPGM